MKVTLYLRFYRMQRFIVLTTVTLASIAQLAIGQNSQSPTPRLSTTVNLQQNEVSFANYKSRDGEILPQLRIQYTTLGTPHKNAQGTVDNAILLLHWTNAGSQALLVPEYQEALFAPGAPLDATRFFLIIPDDIGHGHSSKPSDGLKASFPHYGYGDMVDLQHKLVVESLRLTHLHAIVGMSMGA
jgi:homoserine O-acetyltransferase/O-succinyltransferase